MRPAAVHHRDECRGALMSSDAEVSCAALSRVPSGTTAPRRTDWRLTAGAPGQRYADRVRVYGQRHFYGPLPVGSLLATKSDSLLV
jgi:hypothetical protein